MSSLVNPAILTVLKRVELFQGLSDNELALVAGLCSLARAKRGQVIFREDSDGDELYIVHEGAVEIQVQARRGSGEFNQSTIITMYPGQSFGEIAILGGGTRSASAVASVSPTTLIILPGAQFIRLCETSTSIGYRVMRNMIDDLVYKLRSSSILLRGNVKWQNNQLSQLDQPD